MTERENALCAAAEAEIVLRKLGMPIVFMIGIPSTGEVIRVAMGMSNAGNRAVFTCYFAELMKDHESGRLKS